MSSHHIVREKQEPALLITGLDNFSDELLGQLLEWSPTVVVTADTAEQMQAYGIKIDWLVADEMIDLQQSDIKLVPAAEDKPVITALKQLASEGYHAVNLVTDNFSADDFAGCFEQLDLVVFYEGKKIIAVHPGFSKWKPAGDRMEFLTQPNNFLYTGLLPAGDNVYKTTHDGFISLQFTNPYLLVAEYLD
jgi:thiamine pyrophosphokinase